MQAQTFIFFGQVGSGKGTQAELLANVLEKKDGRECIKTSTGNEYRKLMENGSYIGTLIKDSVIRGELQPNFLTNAIFTNILTSFLTPEKHLISDGYPRNVSQSETFESMMQFYKRKDIKIIYIEVEKDEAIRRMMLRARHDDTKEGIARRFDEYENNVIPAMNYFKNKDEYTIYTINGEQGVEDVHKEIISKLGFLVN
ncbi:MAG: Adenylate kinase [Candidatus Nomurabacteria bacterium GW2011_GWE1_32_28]|uniref:Adenylate kinase n=1 Tax=Candidatus Nomurabacteria bacterium GW2011_GWF1_31_48 TaxID=1618767 RepID=A0A0G0BGV8_9BACT|nr:MAG: Adenylate kinase [Candidatus Nomurabacteria bacterium GW2011_GWF2_30_133]KKP28700.1 MAG: Adenylate kinase [Candidatus Nomurabacteria bacterium GW2011_GWE2_31_40]KKP30277.1 MAG: Adenylate kinase [Candidatus Nomurabacteria bacterium GW2011_GWF1_31_48]KKP34804.1 MAG: Adenylate kinase [Candidatus Nomurabacteria bacterium GW2011_GWE1_32_28]HAS80738.1 hypothetical protein [Candidatus Nomurabacteria bacterium]